MLAKSWKFEVKCCFIGLTHPASCTRARVPLTFGHVRSPPPLNPICSKRVPIDWAWAEVSANIFKFGRSGPGKNWRGGPKNSDPPQTPTSDSTHTYINRQLSTRGFQIYTNLINLTRAVQKLCFLHPPGTLNILISSPGRPWKILEAVPGQPE